MKQVRNDKKSAKKEKENREYNKNKNVYEIHDGGSRDMVKKYGELKK